MRGSHRAFGALKQRFHQIWQSIEELQNKLSGEKAGAKGDGASPFPSQEIFMNC